VAFFLQCVAQGSPSICLAPWLRPSWGAIAHMEHLLWQQPWAGRENLGQSPAFLQTYILDGNVDNGTVPPGVHRLR
jgi:hypothetical protein